MGRNTSGVKGISLLDDDRVVGMVVADPHASLLTVCENGYGKRTSFGPNASSADGETDAASEEEIGSVRSIGLKSAAVRIARHSHQ